MRVVGIVGIVGCARRSGSGSTAPTADGDVFGQRFDAVVELAQPGAAEQLSADPAVEMVEDVRIAPLTSTASTSPCSGSRTSTARSACAALEGRLPAATTRSRWRPPSCAASRVHVGDVVAVGPQRTPMRVVGESFTPEFSHTPYDEGARVTTDGLRRFVPDDAGLKFHKLAVRFRPGTDVGEAVQRLSPATGGVLDRTSPVQDQQNLHGVRQVPLMLGIFLALLAVTAVGHALAAAVRRRRLDLAVLRALGLTRRQARASVAWQATTIAALGVLLGVPLGVAAGRVVWRAVADSTPMFFVAPDDVGGALLVVALAFLVANALAAWPARAAARTPPAEILRVE